MAAYYVRLLQTGNPVRLRQSVPAHLYPALRHFLADAEWDHREVIWHAAARALGRMEVEWLALEVTAVANQYCFAWLAAYDAEHVICADLVLVGPAGITRAVADYAPAQLDVLSTVPDELLRRAPLAIGGAVAEDAQVRAWLDKRGITYSAKVRPSSPSVGTVATGAVRINLRAFVQQLRKRASRDTDVAWIAKPISLHLADGKQRDETLVAYWKKGAEPAGVALTNERDASRLSQTFDPRLRHRALCLLGRLLDDVVEGDIQLRLRR